MTAPRFAFQPLDHVRITAYALGYMGRVSQCVLRPHDRMLYEVEYAANGEIKRGEFNADELEAA